MALAGVGGTASAPNRLPSTRRCPRRARYGIPEGIYRTPELTRDQLFAAGVAAGFAEADVIAFLDADGIVDTASVRLRFADGGWTQLYA